MVGWPLQGYPLACQTTFGMMSVLSHPKVHDPSHKLPRIGGHPACPC